MEYCVLNKIIVKIHYPLPWIDNSLNHLKGAMYFTKLYLTTSYH
jgi:hypothetical protein